MSFNNDGSEEAIKNTLNLDDNAINEDFLPYRVFINDVDSFNAKYIASYIADQYYEQDEKMESKEMSMVGEEGNVLEEEVKEDTLNERHKYEIIGTMLSELSEKSEDVLFLADERAPNFLEEVAKCGVFIFDITRNPNRIPMAIEIYKYLREQYDKLKKMGPKTYANASRKQIFILISTVMTWANTKKSFLEEPGPFNESHYRKRRAHPAFKEHLLCEKEILSLSKRHKNKLKTYILNAGFTYGYEEDYLDIFFKMAWDNEQHLPIFGNGSNYIPLIHISDLAQILGNMLMNPPSKRYILAVEPTSSKLNKIVKAISENFGKGFVTEVPNVEEAHEVYGVDAKAFSTYSVNLNMSPDYILRNIPLEWHCETGFCNNINKIVDELKESRGLNPLKIMIHGPPGVGKTRLAKKICETYGLHYVSISTLIEETLQGLRDKITEEKRRLQIKKEKEEQNILAVGDNVDEETSGEEEEEEEEEDEGADIEEWEEQIRDIQATLSENENNRLPDEQVIRLLKTFLESNICQNKGFVLDGYPKTNEQAEELFGRLGDDDEEEEEEEIGEGDEDDDNKIEAIANSKIMPQFIFSLQAPDNFLIKRIKKLQEKQIEGTHYTEENMKRRLEQFREINTEDETVLNFFDEIEVHPILIDATQEKTEDMKIIFDKISETIGEPIKFGIVLEELIEIRLAEDKRIREENENFEALKKIQEKKDLENYKIKMEKWSDTLEIVQMEEEKIIIAESEPLRNYLMEFIFPTLTKALTELVKIKPDDPVDFVAEYLLKINPEAKLFDPTYSKKGEEILKICEDTSNSLNLELP